MSTEIQSGALETSLEGLHLLHRGKVRDIYAVGEHELLIVATDRLSAFDVVLPQQIVGKGVVLTNLSHFWFDQTVELVPNHAITTDVEQMPAEVRRHADLLAGRAMLVRRCVPLEAEFVVRGYLAGSGWKEYQELGSVSGHALPAGLRECDQLPEPLLTPSTKAATGEHDESLTIPQLGKIVGTRLASQAGALSLALYEHAATLARSRGIILADTKLEFGLYQDRLKLIDEVFTPDSSRYWSAADYEPGRRQDSFDKQIIRDALEDAGWNKQAPAPELPDHVLDKAQQRYLEIHRLLVGDNPS